MAQAASDDHTNVVEFPQTEGPVCVLPGLYQMAFSDFETRTMFRHSPKLILWFTVTDPGQAFGVKLARYYNVERIMGKRGRHRMFKAKFHGEFVREYALLFRERPRRLDRIPMTKFENVIVEGEVATVRTDYQQRERPDAIRYSIIRELKGLV